MRLIIKHIRVLMILFCLCLAAGLLFMNYIRLSGSPFAQDLKSRLKTMFYFVLYPDMPDPNEGLTGEFTRLTDMSLGLMVDLPLDSEFDYSLRPRFVTAQNESYKAFISREWSVGLIVDDYIDYYFNRFVLNEGWRETNNISLLEYEKREGYEILTLRLNGVSEGFNQYTYLLFKTQTRYFYRIMLKHSSDTDMSAEIERIIKSFKYFSPREEAEYVTDFYPILPDYWTDETAELYERILSAESPVWGIFTRDIKGDGLTTEVERVEEIIDYKFDIVLAYAHLNEEFPTDFMRRCYGEGRIVELTYQLTTTNNLDMFGNSPVLNMYSGTEYEEIREFARAARDFGHPFLFRLNNEMNSDWTSYGGVNNLSDPDIFIHNWRAVYEIFEQEGVDNAIWIFNPNDRDCPPNAWNSFAGYYPGNGYVHMLGITGYNNGTYFAEQNGEEWREFDVIYDKIVSDMAGMFDSFPWIITEFSSSSIGGDKAAWINRMFANLYKYPQIKAAVWFSLADYDPADEETVSRPYWLDESEETLEAFKNGLKK